MPLSERELEAEMSEARLYTKHAVDLFGNATIEGYAYGEPWVAQALYMDDIQFPTAEEAKAWWEKNYGKGADKH